MQVGNAEDFGLGLDLSLVVNVGLREFMFEETFVVVPRFFGRAFRQARQVFRISDRFGTLAATLRNFGKQSEIEPLYGLAAFVGQLGADAAFVFEAGNLVAARAAVVPNPLLALFFQLRVFHEGSRSIG